MKVFISHSGERSRALAERIHWFVRMVIPSSDPWISTGIDEGSRWESEVAQNLEQAAAGIVSVFERYKITSPGDLRDAARLLDVAATHTGTR